MIAKSGILLQILLAAALLCGCAAAQDVQSGGSADMNIADALASLGASEFSSAVESAGLSGTLNNEGVLVAGSGSFVVFAPSDEAIAASDLDAIKENATLLKSILSHHVVWTTENISDLSSVRTLQGENLTIDSADGLKVKGASVGASQSYGSGIVYVIDAVLMPEMESTLGVVQAAEDLGASKFADAVKSAGLAETLDGQGLMGIEGLAAGPFTVFAPSDEAFENARDSLAAIEKKEGGMLSLLSYHVVDAQGLANMTVTSSVKTMLGDSLAVDPQTGLVGGAYILKSERFSNGIVYVIDRVLIPIRLAMA